MARVLACTDVRASPYGFPTGTASRSVGFIQLIPLSPQTDPSTYVTKSFIRQTRLSNLLTEILSLGVYLLNLISITFPGFLISQWKWLQDNYSALEDLDQFEVMTLPLWVISQCPIRKNTVHKPEEAVNCRVHQGWLRTPSLVNRSPLWKLCFGQGHVLTHCKCLVNVFPSCLHIWEAELTLSGHW